MLTRSITQCIARPIVRGITAVGGLSKDPLDDYQDATLVLDFVADLYAVQSVEEANANAMNPRPSLILDFINDQYFVEA